MNRMARFLGLVFAVVTAIGAAGCERPRGLPDDVVDGRKLFRGNCAMCHGPNGEGMPKLGKNLTTNAFVKGLSDEELVQFLKVGRSAGDPLNERGIDMPPKGGNPALSDQDLARIADYVRFIQ